ncbi:MAG: hypothetical protein II126_04610, partial [Erysipelotrichaceae bacterium]|nr:hypothetical protein [Erysipelotrichaceae bacterium]
MKRILKIVLAEMLVFTCILSAVRPVFAATDSQLKGEIIAYFSASAPSVPWGQDPGPLWENTGHTDADVERKLQELEKQNPEEGAKWRKIIDFWYEANSEGFTNEYHPIKNEEGEYVINTEEMVTTFPNDNSLCFFGYGNRMQNDGSMSAENVGRCETLLALAQQ